MSNIQEISKKMTDKVAERVEQMESKGELHLPLDYSAGNACRAAFLQLQEVKDKNGKPALDVVSKGSLFNSLLNMVTLGLTPSKDQGYFIVYGKTLTFQPSYFGNLALAKRMAGVKDIYPQVIYKEDDFSYNIKRGRIVDIEHKQKFGNQSGEIAGAYCVVTFDDDRPDWIELMNISDIQDAWSQGNYNPNSKYKGAHEKFGQEMAKKTVANRALKRYIKSSSDEHLDLNQVKAATNENNKKEQIDNVKQEDNASEEFIEAEDIEEVEVVENEDQEEEEGPEINDDDVDKALEEDKNMPWDD